MDIPDWNPFENLTRNTHLQNYGRFKGFKHQKLSKLFDMSKIDMKLIKKTFDNKLNENEDFDASYLVDLTDILLEKNIYARKMHDKIQDIIMRPEIQESKNKNALR